MCVCIYPSMYLSIYICIYIYIYICIRKATYNRDHINHPHPQPESFSRFLKHLDVLITYILRRFNF